VKGRKEHGKENSDNEEEAFLWKKPMTRLKAIRRRKGIKMQKRKRLAHVITVRRKGTLKSIAGRKIRQRCPSCMGRRRMLRLGK
jgi:hypothetical protein